MVSSPHAKIRVRAILFDLDGTLVDSSLDLAQSANYVRRHLGLTPLSHECIRTYVGDGARILMQRVLADAPPSCHQEGLALFKQHYAIHCTDFTRAYTGCAEILKVLAGKKIAVVTNKPDSMSHQVLTACGLAHYIGLIVGGDTARHKKPAPEHLLQAVEWAGCQPEEAIMIGDGPNDIEAARAARIRCFGVTYGIGQPFGRSGQIPDLLLDSLQSLPDILD